MASSSTASSSESTPAASQACISSSINVLPQFTTTTVSRACMHHHSLCITATHQVVLPNPASYSQGHLPLTSHRKPFGGPVGAAHRLSTLPQSGSTPTHIHPQVSHPNGSGTVQHQSYTNHPVPGQYPSPSRYQPPHHNHHNATASISTAFFCTARRPCTQLLSTIGTICCCCCVDWPATSSEFRCRLLHPCSRRMSGCPSLRKNLVILLITNMKSHLLWPCRRLRCFEGKLKKKNCQARKRRSLPGPWLNRSKWPTKLLIYSVVNLRHLRLRVATREFIPKQ
jgi:hypothetical protein